jgi:hypothetical protein
MVQAKVKRKVVQQITDPAHVYNELRGIATFASD